MICKTQYLQDSEEHEMLGWKNRSFSNITVMPVTYLVSVIWVCACWLQFVLYIGKWTHFLLFFVKLTQITQSKRMVRNNELVVNKLEILTFFFSLSMVNFKMLHFNITSKKNQREALLCVMCVGQTGIRDVKLIIYAFSWFAGAVLGMHAVSLSLSAHVRLLQHRFPLRSDSSSRILRCLLVNAAAAACST